MKKTKFRRLAAMAASLLCCLIFTVPAYAQSSEPQPETAPSPAETEAENLEIVQLVRAMRLTPQELTAMLSGNGIPGIAPMPTDYDEQEDNADEE